MSVMMDVVIVSYAKNEKCLMLTSDCLDSLLESETPGFFNVFVVESNPDINWDDSDRRIKTIPAPLPYGYHKFLNAGIKEGNSDFVALCNNDLTFSKNWASEIIDFSRTREDVLSFSPICPLTQPLYGINENSGIYLGHQIRVHISGWCIVQKRKIYDNIPKLDESFEHWYCDNDYAITLHKAGLPHALVTSSIVKHHNSNIGETTKNVIEDPAELERLTTGASAKLISKWKL